jgi:hypothetical protein
VNIITDPAMFDHINAASISSANPPTAKDSNVNQPQTLTIPVARAIRDTEEGFLDLLAVREGLITIEADGSFKDTEKLTTLINALATQVDALTTKLKAEGLSIKEAARLEDSVAALGGHHSTGMVLEALAEMLPIASRVQLFLIV